MRPIAVVTLAMLALCVPEGHAQQTQVPLNEEGTLEVIDTEMEHRLDLFVEYDGFQEARLFKKEDGAFELVIQYRPSQEILRDRKGLTAEEVRALRRRISRRLQAKNMRRLNIDRQGRYKFLAATTALTGLQGALIPEALSIKSDEVYISAPLFGAAGGFFVPLLLSRNASVTEAEATMTLYGGLQGAVHGVLLSSLVGGGRPSDQGTAAAVAVLSAGEAVAAHAFTDDFELSSGQAEMMGYGSFFGLGMGFGTGALVVGERDAPEADDEFEATVEGRTVLGTAFAGTLIGSYVGYRMAQAGRFTQGDARLASLAGLLGTQTGITALTVADVEGVRPVAGVLVGGALAGLSVGRLLVLRHDFSRSQANISTLGAAAGSLLGTAVTVAAKGNDKTGMVLSTIGSVAGFSLAYLVNADDARSSQALGWRLEIRPQGLQGLAVPGKKDPLHPVLTFRRRF